MPPIRQISCDKNALKFTDQKGVEHIFDTSNIPQGKDTTAKLESYINDEWLPPLLDGQYQLKVHIFSLAPLQMSPWAGDNGVRIPADWWSDA